MPAVSPRAVARRVLDRVEKGGAWATPRSMASSRARASTIAIGGSRPSSSTACFATARGSIARSRRTPICRRTPPRCCSRCASPRISCCSSIACRPTPPSTTRSRRRARSAGRSSAGFANAVLRKLDTAEGARAADARRARASRSSTRCRAWILDELAAAIDGDEAAIAARAAAFAQSAPLVARVNRLQARRARRSPTEIASTGSRRLDSRTASLRRRRTPGCRARCCSTGSAIRRAARRSLPAVDGAGQRARSSSPRSPRRARASASSTRARASAASRRTSPS